jgi:hypothetical protein
MTNSIKLLLRKLPGAAALIVLASPLAYSQALNSNTATVTLTATLGESLTVAATPANVTFALVSGGVAAGSAPVVVTTQWLLGAGRANVELDAYFASATAALTSGGGTPSLIPTSAVLGQMLTGTPTAFTPFTGSGVLGTAGGGLVLFTQALNSSTRAVTRTDNLSLEINTSGLPQLPAGTYTGTVTIQAQAL